MGRPSGEETRGCLVPDTAPGGFTADPPLGKAEPIRHGCGALVEMYPRKGRNPWAGRRGRNTEKVLERKKEQRDEER